MTGQNVQHDAGGMDVVRQRLGAGGLHRIDAIRQHGSEDIDHLPVAAKLAFQLALHAAQGLEAAPIP